MGNEMTAISVTATEPERQAARAGEALDTAGSHTGREAAATLKGVGVAFVDPKTKQSKSILADFDFECSLGEFVVLVGRSGCGKTTVLNILSGLLTPTSGVVEVLGKSPRAARSKIGYMFARDALMPWRRAVQNVELPLERDGVERGERRHRAEAMLARLGLEGKGALYSWQLSQGMRQRVALARTWVSGPELLLMDEPFAALDAQTKGEVRAVFVKIWEERRRSVVFVTHDLSEALLLGDRIVMLAPGCKEVVNFKVPFPHPRNVSELPFTKEFRELEHHLAQKLM